MEASLAAEMGLSSHPLLSVKKWEENLTKLASLSWSRVWNALRLGGELKREERWSLRDSHVRRRKIERRKGKAWGLLRKKKREERDGVRVSEVWLLMVLGCEILLGFTIIVDKIWRSTHRWLCACVYWIKCSLPPLSLRNWAWMMKLFTGPGPILCVGQARLF